MGAGVPWGSSRFGDSEATEQVERGADIRGHGQPILESQAAPRRGAPVSEPGRPHQPLVAVGRGVLSRGLLRIKNDFSALWQRKSYGSGFSRGLQRQRGRFSKSPVTLAPCPSLTHDQFQALCPQHVAPDNSSRPRWAFYSSRTRFPQRFVRVLLWNFPLYHGAGVPLPELPEGPRTPQVQATCVDATGEHGAHGPSTTYKPVCGLQR